MSSLFPVIAAMQVLKVMELCAGAGGTSFLCQRATMHGKSLELRAMWAFDIAEDASAAYQVHVVCGCGSVHVGRCRLVKTLCASVLMRVPCGHSALLRTRRLCTSCVCACGPDASGIASGQSARTVTSSVDTAPTCES